MKFLHYWNKQEYYFEKVNFLFKIVLDNKIFLKNIRFMSENFTTNDIENDEFNSNSDESVYRNLITRLKEIKKTIDLLEKTIFK